MGLINQSRHRFWVANGLLIDKIGIDSPKPVEMVVRFIPTFLFDFR